MTLDAANSNQLDGGYEMKRLMMATLAMVLMAPIARAQVATPAQYELTNPKAIDHNLGSAAVPQTLTASGDSAVYYSPELPIAPGVTKGAISVTVTQATGSVSLTATPLYSAGQSGTTTPSDQITSGATTSVNLLGASPLTVCVPFVLLPGAKTVRILFKNTEGTHTAILKAAPANF